MTFGLLLLPHVIETVEHTDMYELYMLVRSWIGETCCRKVYMKRLIASEWIWGILVMAFDQYLQGNCISWPIYTDIRGQTHFSSAHGFSVLLEDSLTL